MIERLLRGNTLALKRWRRLKRQKRVVVAAWALGALSLASFTARSWNAGRIGIVRFRRGVRKRAPGSVVRCPLALSHRLNPLRAIRYVRQVQFCFPTSFRVSCHSMSRS